MIAPPAALDAMRSTMSFVDVSPSMVTRLNDVATAPRSAVSHARALSGASVVMKASIVAMSGRIMPLPFAMPPTV